MSNRGQVISPSGRQNARMNSRHQQHQNLKPGSQSRSPYFARLQRVLDHIAGNLADELRLEDLCTIACFSPFHFHRQFRYATGLPLNRYIRLVRLKQACYQLVYYRDRKIGDIGGDIGFNNSESFSRAFTRELGCAPSAFRAEPDWGAANALFEPLNSFFPREHNLMQVRIITQLPIPVAALEYQGPPQRLHHAVMQFIEWRKTSGQSPEATSMTIGVPMNDPNTVAPGEFRFDICGSLQEGEEVEPNDFSVIRKIIPGGRFAVLRHRGSTDLIDKPCYWLYGEWLPESGEELRHSPLFFHYIERMPRVSEADQLTDIYLPLK